MPEGSLEYGFAGESETSITLEWSATVVSIAAATRRTASRPGLSLLKIPSASSELVCSRWAEPEFSFKMPHHGYEGFEKANVERRLSTNSTSKG